MEHELLLDGETLRETKEMSTLKPSFGAAEQVLLIHTRMIGQRVYQVRETKEGSRVLDVTVTTTMSALEVQDFEAEWRKLWIPGISDSHAAGEVLPPLELELMRK
jgi:hypothetical protein